MDRRKEVESLPNQFYLLNCCVIVAAKKKHQVKLTDIFWCIATYGILFSLYSSAR